MSKVLIGNIRQLHFHLHSGFFKASDYEAAINALSQAICLNPMLPVYPLHVIIFIYYIIVLVILLAMNCG